MTHDLSNRSKYPRHHLWETASKINVYSTERIDTGDKMILKGETVTVTKSSCSKANEEYANGKAMFYELDIQ